MKRIIIGIAWATFAYWLTYVIAIFPLFYLGIPMLEWGNHYPNTYNGGIAMFFTSAIFAIATFFFYLYITKKTID
tara:strand:+ start:494 stop:718 length:225 start_codon:yes stop_codon:yes gene_type:complete